MSVSKGLFSIIEGLRKEKKELKILVLGLDNAGKTTILKTLSNQVSNFHQDIKSISPTQGFNIKNLSLDGFKLNVWDIGGQQALRQYWSNYFEHNNALIYVIDSADTNRLKQSGMELQKLLNVRKNNKEKQICKIPLLVYANKQDLAQAKPADEIAQTLKLSKIKDRQWSIVSCSAKTQEGLQEGLQWLIQQSKK